MYEDIGRVLMLISAVAGHASLASANEQGLAFNFMKTPFMWKLTRSEPIYQYFNGGDGSPRRDAPRSPRCKRFGVASAGVRLASRSQTSDIIFTRLTTSPAQTLSEAQTSIGGSSSLSWASPRRVLLPFSTRSTYANLHDVPSWGANRHFNKWRAAEAEDGFDMCQQIIAVVGHGWVNSARALPQFYRWLL
jgi:hypothetical protein